MLLVSITLCVSSAAAAAAWYLTPGFVVRLIESVVPASLHWLYPLLLPTLAFAVWVKVFVNY